VHEAVVLNGQHFKVAMAATHKITLDQDRRSAGRGGNGLPALPRIIYVIVFVEVVHERRAFSHQHLKVSMTAALEIALDDRPRTGGDLRDDLSATPGIIHVVVLVKIMDKVIAFENNHFKIAMAAFAKVALNHRGCAGTVRGDDLSSHPGLGNIVVLVKVMDEIVAFGHNHFKISMIAAAKIALDDAARPGGIVRDHLSANPRVLHVPVVVPVVDEIAALQYDRLKVPMPVTGEITLDHASGAGAYRQQNGLWCGRLCTKKGNCNEKEYACLQMANRCLAEHAWNDNPNG